jgi:hypothetical protein
MSQNFYFLVLVGFLVLCVISAMLYRQPVRPCPACGRKTPTQNRRCRYCGYTFAAG